jgi:hypothetical protein
MAMLEKMLKFGVFVLLVSTTFHAVAEFNRSPFLKSRGHGKVQKALARSYMQKGATSVQESRSVVNIGSRRAGNCTLNVGTGTKDSKDIIVTAKEIINVCR